MIAIFRVIMTTKETRSRYLLTVIMEGIMISRVAAEKKWCPYTDMKQRCITDECMAWEWVVKVTESGYCRLIGRDKPYLGPVTG